MTAKKQEQQQTVPGKQERQQHDAHLGNCVLHALGQPHDLHRVQVRQLWSDHYRVNIFVGLDGASAKVAHSFFLVVDAAGNITACNPELTKQY